MFKNLKFSIIKIIIAILLLVMAFMACKKEDNTKNKKETILVGKTSILVDESIFPIADDEVSVFESQYDAKIKLIAKPESDVINRLISNEAQIAILSRKLTKEEETVFINKKITPKITAFATDAVVLIINKEAKDTLVDLQEVIYLLQGKPSKIKGLVFENPNSSTVNYMSHLAGVKNDKIKGVFSLNSHEDVLKYITENPGLIGVVGLNSIVQPTPSMELYNGKFKVMAVKNVKKDKANLGYYKPTQSNLAEGLYPLSRELYLLNYQGADGLGMGFASFIAGEIGQRIILKSGLLPIRIPSRTVTIRKEILNTK